MRVSRRHVSSSSSPPTSNAGGGHAGSSNGAGVGRGPGEEGYHGFGAPVSSSASAATGAAVSSEAGDSEGPSSYSHYVPSLRSALPPSEVELPETSFLQCLEKEIMDEKLRLDREEGPPPIPDGWEVHHTDGTSFFYARRLWLPPPRGPASDGSDDPIRAIVEGGEGKGEPKASADSEHRAGDDGTVSKDQQLQNAVPGPHSTAHDDHHHATTQQQRRLFRAEKHFIRVQLTTRDASLDPECDVRGEHFPFSFFVQRVVPPNAVPPLHAASSSPSATALAATAERDAEAFMSVDWSRWVSADGVEDESAELSLYQNSIEVRCDVVEGELVIDEVVYHGEWDLDALQGGKKKRSPTSSSTSSSAEQKGEGTSGNEKEDVTVNSSERRQSEVSSAASADCVVRYNNPFGGYPGPNLDEAEEEVLDGLQAWLAERRIDDQLGEFVGQYSVWIEQAEYERWLQHLYDYVAA